MVSTYFKFQGALCEFDTIVQSADIGRRTDKQACESLREDFFTSQRAGQNFCIDLGDTTPDFTDRFNDADVFPTEQIFNRPAWFEMNKNDAFNSEVGGFIAEGFQMTIRSAAETEEQVLQIVNKIPGFSEHFKCIIIE